MKQTTSNHHGKDWRLVLLFHCLFLASTSHAQERTISLDLTVVPAKARLIVGEGFEYRVELGNTSEERVRIRHTQTLSLTGLEVRRGADFSTLGSERSSTWALPDSIVLEPDQKISFYGPPAGTIGSRNTGVFDIRARAVPARATLGEEQEELLIRWNTPIVTIEIVPADAFHDTALQFLKIGQSNASRVFMVYGMSDRYELMLIEFYSDFLDRFPGTVYDRQVRYALIASIGRLLDGGSFVREKSAAEVERVKQLWRQNLQECLKFDGAYREALLDWKPESGSTMLGLAARFGRTDLFDALCREFDRQMPDDLEGRLFREITREGYFGSIEKAKALALKYKNDFPQGEHAEHMDLYIEALKKQRE